MSGLEISKSSENESLFEASQDLVNQAMAEIKAFSARFVDSSTIVIAVDMLSNAVAELQEMNLKITSRAFQLLRSVERHSEPFVVQRLRRSEGVAFIEPIYRAGLKPFTARFSVHYAELLTSGQRAISIEGLLNTICELAVICPVVIQLDSFNTLLSRLQDLAKAQRDLSKKPAEIAFDKARVSAFFEKYPSPFFCVREIMDGLLEKMFKEVLVGELSRDASSVSITAQCEVTESPVPFSDVSKYKLKGDDEPSPQGHDLLEAFGY